jgi:hypothetical protein
MAIKPTGAGVRGPVSFALGGRRFQTAHPRASERCWEPLILLDVEAALEAFA